MQVWFGEFEVDGGGLHGGSRLDRLGLLLQKTRSEKALEQLTNVAKICLVASAAQQCFRLNKWINA
jgi:hypothetical protein